MTEVNHDTKVSNCVPRHGCDRPECLERRRRYMSIMKKREELGYSQWTPLDEVVRAIEGWRARGYSLPQIARAARVKQSTVESYVCPNPAKQNVHVDQANRILNIDLSRELPNARVDALPAQRVFRALMRQGHSRHDIAAELTRMGMPSRAKWISDITHGAMTQTRAWKIDVVLDLLDRWSLRAGTDKRATTWARNRGWPPALAWDLETIRDPKARPSGVST